MPIPVDCPACRASFRVGDQHAGKAGRCPRCREVVRVPQARPAQAEVEVEETYGLDDPSLAAPARAAAVRAATRASAKVASPALAPSRPTRTPMEILAAFRGEIRPVRPTLLYRAWILIIAATMVLLPAIYVALIGLVGYAVYLHATANLAIIQNVRNIKVALILYAGPLAAGAIVIAFMLKPLFARPAKRPKVRKVDPSKEPLIAAFVDGVCSSVGAPRPSRIEVDCQVNASAQLASWVFSPRRDLVLTIGLPLVAGLSLREFTGVLAHEFGHFSQGAGMRLSLLIRSINHWFARVVYERDEWDQTLVEWSGSGQGALILVSLMARPSVWLTRRVLWILMVTGHAVSGFLSRQMEFDADRYEARMVGGDTFGRTMGRIGELGLASNAAHNELATSWRERRLPDDLPRLIQHEAAKIPPPLLAALEEAREGRRSGLFDTHPADRDRVARALAEGTEGIFRLGGPATDLFGDFDALSRDVTFDYYRSILGPGVTRDQLYPITDAVADQEIRREGDEAFARLFLGALGPFQALPLPPAYPATPADPKAARRGLTEARKALRASREEAVGLVGSWEQLHARAAQAEAALALLKAGKAIKPGDFGLARPNLAAAQAALDEAEAEGGRVAEALGAFGAAAAARLIGALGLLELDVVVARVADGQARRDEARALYPCALALGSRVVADLEPAARSGLATALVGQLYQAGKEDDQGMINALLRAGATLHERLTALKWKVGDAVAYPFEHAQQGVTLGRFALPEVPDAKAVGDLLQAGAEARQRLLDLHRRVFGRLATTVEAVEQAFGLTPLAADPGR